jgi:hypothetical protein
MRASSQPVFLFDEFGGSILWKDISLWTDLFKRLVDIRMKSELDKKNKGRFLNKMLTNVQKAITGKEDEENANLLVG